jgi:hypothetical protein
MVVDIVNIGIGRRCIWPYSVITPITKTPTIVGVFFVIYSCVHPTLPKTQTTLSGGLCFWWETACTNRAENKQEFSDLMKLVKLFKEKWLISPDGEN